MTLPLLWLLLRKVPPQIDCLQTPLFFFKIVSATLSKSSEAETCSALLAIKSCKAGVDICLSCLSPKRNSNSVMSFASGQIRTNIEAHHGCRCARISATVCCSVDYVQTVSVVYNDFMII